MLGELKFALLQKGLVIVKDLKKKIELGKGGITKRENPKTNQVCITNTNVQVLTQHIYNSHKICTNTLKT
jgi:hypothetical protein